jgi:hypothetical protein
VECLKESQLKADQRVVVSSFGLMEMQPVSGRTLKVSGTLLQLRVSNPIPRGSPVKVQSNCLEMLAEVRRCQFDGDGYIVGLTLFPDRKPSLCGGSRNRINTLRWIVMTLVGQHVSIGPQQSRGKIGSRFGNHILCHPLKKIIGLMRVVAPLFSLNIHRRVSGQKSAVHSRLRLSRSCST